ncbi:MAG: M56 family metallopeptidase, partial [Burkholderiales bacterium]|nr:M56 family metallopeptidase [Burkholderiales bacterium]
LAGLHLAALMVLPALTLALMQATLLVAAQAPLRGPLVAAQPSGADAVRVVLALAATVGWALGVLAMLLRLAREARGLGRLRDASAPACARVRASLRRAVRRGLVDAAPAVRAAAVDSPQVAGWWRPWLLVPRDLAERLAPAELDAVLLHELAHVRRGDLRWNLLQRLVLALLWFHPAAWWLQASLARERERCCDALAVRHGASRAALARALVKLAEAATRSHTRGTPRLALDVSRGDGLVERVRALVDIDAPARAAPARKRVALALALSAACLLAMGAGRAATADPSLGDLYMASALGPTFDIQAHDAAGPFALRVRQGHVLGASVRDQPVGVRQEGSRVTLTDAAQAPLLVLTVTPQGRVQWQSRR